MNDVGLLTAVRKYKRSGNDPFENFLTEAFAWVLNKTSFSCYFIEKLDKEISNGEETDKNGVFETQVNLNGVRPDMVYKTDTGQPFIFEHKTWSNLGLGQLSNYRAIDKSAKIILITAAAYQHSGDANYALCWNNVYEYISDFIENKKDNLDTIEHYTLSEFLNLLSSEGLGPQDPIKLECIIPYSFAIKLNKQCKDFLDQLANDDLFTNAIKEVLPPDYDFNKENEGSFWDRKSRWGRMGFDLLGVNWEICNPGIFVGFILDGEDHKIKTSSKGPNFSFVFSFKKEFHNTYEDNEHYRSLCNRLDRELEGWQVIDNTKGHEINRWHPLSINKPMYDVFIGATDYKEQSERFKDETIFVLKEIFKNDDVRKLRDSLSAHSQ